LQTKCNGKFIIIYGEKSEFRVAEKFIQQTREINFT